MREQAVANESSRMVKGVDLQIPIIQMHHSAPRPTWQNSRRAIIRLQDTTPRRALCSTGSSRYGKPMEMEMEDNETAN